MSGLGLEPLELVHWLDFSFFCIFLIIKIVIAFVLLEVVLAMLSEGLSSSKEHMLFSSAGLVRKGGASIASLCLRVYFASVRTFLLGLYLSL